MKLDENKHDHKLTNWLKVGIFAMLMIAPLFASITQTLYATFNKNAYQSYSDQNIVLTKTNITNLNQANIGSVVNFTYKYAISNSNSDTSILPFESLSFDPIDFGFLDLPYTKIQISTRPSSNLIMLYTDDNRYNYKNIWGTDLTSFAITTNSNSAGTCINATTIAAIYTYVPKKLDSAFYYGVDQMTKSDLFNWTQNTALYTGINAMTTQLEIQTPAIAILLTYWFILTIMYVIIDIVLKGFTLLTHMFSNKV